jgi:hypothetical protein
LSPHQITNTVNNFILQTGANSDHAKNTNAAEFGDVLLQGGKLYAPFAIANGGNLIPKGGTLQNGINTFLAQNPNNTAANLTNFMTHAVAYFSFGNANPDGTEHLQNRGNNVFGFEDLPGNLGISDFDFNDAVFKFTLYWLKTFFFFQGHLKGDRVFLNRESAIAASKNVGI